MPRREDDDEDRMVRALIRAEGEPHYLDLLLRERAVIHCTLGEVRETFVYGARKWIATFRVQEVEEPQQILRPGSLVLRSWNPPSGTHLGLQHHLSADWLAVTGRRLRTLPARYSARSLISAAFRGVVVRAETTIVSRCMEKESREWRKRPDAEHYSRICRFLGRVAGTPPLLRQRGEP